MLNKSEIAILTIAVSIGSQNYFKMKQCRHFMQITYSPNNVLITMSCRLRGGCERLPGGLPLLHAERTACGSGKNDKPRYAPLLETDRCHLSQPRLPADVVRDGTQRHQSQRGVSGECRQKEERSCAHCRAVAVKHGVAA